MKGPPRRLRICGIYAISGADERTYVGASKDVIRRINQHYSYLRAGTHRNRRLQREWSKHGEAWFTCGVLEICTSERFLAREKFWCAKLHAATYGYSLYEPGGPSGYRHTQASRQRMSDSAKKRKWTPEGLKKRRAATRKMTQRIWSDPAHARAHRRAMSLAQLNRSR